MGKVYLSKVFEIAKSELGYKEKKSNKDLYDKTANAGSGNFTKYADTLDKISFFNGKKNGFPWCSVFQHYLVYVASNKDVKKTKEMMCIPSGENLAASCTYSYSYFKKKNLVGTKAKVGALIYFGDDEKHLTHIGIVYKVDSSKIYTYEGNASNSTKKCSYSAKNHYLYAYPKWDAEDTQKPSEDKDDKSTTDDSTKPQEAKYKVTATSGLRIRKEPNTSSKILGVMPKGSIFTVTKTENNWAYGTWNKITGWSSMDWLKKS